MNILAHNGYPPISNHEAIRSLVIDDDPKIADSLESILNSSFDNVTVSYADTTFAGIQKASSFRPTVVILDAIVNKASGINLIPFFKNNLPGVVCIVLTSSRDAEITAQAMHSGADEYLFKPVDVNRLIDAIDNKLLHNNSEQEFKYRNIVLREMFNNCVNLLLLTKKDGTIIDMNEALISATGEKKEEIYGKNIMSSFMWDYSAATRKRIRNKFSKAQAGNFIRDEIIIKSHNQSISTVDYSFKPIKNSRSEVEIILFEGREINAYKKQEKRMYDLAHFDQLTRLPNRILFQDRLALSIRAAKRYNRVLAVLFIDIDNFKNINDTFGHNSGDNLLLVTASKIKNCLREVDTVSRLSGDEFAVILSEVKNTDTTIDTAKRIIEAASNPVSFNAYQMLITTSIGIALYPNDALNANDLLASADKAMYLAKQAGKNNYKFFQDIACH